MRDHGSSKEGTSQDAEDESSQSVDDVPIDVVDAVESTMQSPSAMFGMDMCFTNWDMLTDPTLPSMMPDSTASFTDFLSATAVDDDGSRCGAVSVAASSGTVPSSTMISNVMFGSPPSLNSASNSSSDVSFPDSYLLPVHELTLLRAMLRIADRLGCKGQLWSLDALSPFNQGIATPSHQLPLAWRPTASQVLIPHHPLFDFLPWPNVRDKIIGILSLPDDARPPAASGPLALVNFAYDFEDNAEGVRIYGSDPCDPDCWEVGQVLFQRWWFLFDREIIDKSNHWRRLRGAPLLALTASDAENNAPNAT
jgi:hypothetical protein